MRFILSTFTVFLVIFLIFGLIELGLEDAQIYQGKIVIVSISIILGAIAASVIPMLFKATPMGKASMLASGF
jgi:hypothetical protein